VKSELYYEIEYRLKQEKSLLSRA